VIRDRIIHCEKIWVEDYLAPSTDTCVGRSSTGTPELMTVCTSVNVAVPAVTLVLKIDQRDKRKLGENWMSGNSASTRRFARNGLRIP
jgi:hypothetical protein